MTQPFVARRIKALFDELPEGAQLSIVEMAERAQVDFANLRRMRQDLIDAGIMHLAGWRKGGAGRRPEVFAKGRSDKPEPKRPKPDPLAAARRWKKRNNYHRVQNMRKTARRKQARLAERAASGASMWALLLGVPACGGNDRGVGPRAASCARSHTTDGLGGVPPPPTFNDKEMNMEHELKHGQAMVITGPQGCGKTTLARKIAAQHGTFAEIDAHELETHFDLGRALDSEPDTLVVEGFPTSAETLAEIKAALTNDTIICHRKYQEPKKVKAPNFIFCSGDENALHLDAQDRRFFVVRLGDNGR